MNNAELMHQLNKDVARINGYYTSWCKLSNKNSSEIDILYALYLNQSITQKEICNTYALPKQTINNIVKDLENKNYLCLIPNDNDHRSKLLTLTKQGEEYMKDILKGSFELDERAAEILGSEDLQALVKLQEKFANAVKQAMEELK